MGGQASFRFILVFDVSRWGRFQDTDDAAHYEYVCKSAGIPIHYCAEQFSNEGKISDSLLKTLKRFMAGEFSRDLSERAAGDLCGQCQSRHPHLPFFHDQERSAMDDGGM
jgi:DNA invertase Pin-like site-specific DNA recombinase